MNAMNDFGTERRLQRWGRLVRQGLPSAGRYQRYIKSIAPVLGVIWGLTIAYVVLLPRTYSSEFSLILPGSGMGSSINVESIGQAQTLSNSAFASPTLSPTENYKQLITADVTVRAAARLAHENEDRFPAPTIKLVDQTNLISITITGRTPQMAHARAEALRAAFSAELDALRADEAAKREGTDIKQLNELSGKVQAAQRRLIAFQVMHGLGTLEQFNARIAAVDALREKERDLRVQMRQQDGIAGRLSGTLGTGPRGANVMMRLRNDPVFQELATRFAASNADAEQKAGTLGPRHSAMAQANAERDELRIAMLQRGRELTGLPDGALLKMTDFQLTEGRSNLMQTMSVSDAQAAGTRASLAELNGDIAQAKAEAPQWITLASQLADLQRDLRVTEAVFSSAMARLDTNRQDPYASYPLVQVLAAPSLPTHPSSPSVVIALAGAVAASLLTLIAFGLLWLRQPILDRMLRKP